MADKFRITKDGNKVVEGLPPLTIDGLEPDTQVAAGDYQAVRIDGDRTSDPVDIPSFKTKAIKVTGVSLDQDEITLKVGETAQLNVTINPDNATNQNYKFMSSNRQIASPDNNGLVEAVSAGSADAIVQTEDGEHEATCKVNVVESEPEQPEEPNESEEDKS